MDEIVAAFFGGMLIVSIGHPVARLALPCLSFGKVYAQPLSAAENSFNVFGYRHDGNGRIEVGSTLASAVGFVIFLIALIWFGSLISTLF